MTSFALVSTEVGTVLTQQEPKEALVGKRLRLVRPRLDLAAAIFQHVDRDRERLGAFLPWVELTRSVTDTEAWIKRAEDTWQAGTEFSFAIQTIDESVLLGGLGVHDISWTNASAEIGYWIAQGYEGKGFMAEAIHLAEAELFRLGFNRLQIRSDVRNARSRAVAERCGYVHEGTHRQDAYEFGRFRDTHVFAKLRGDKQKGGS